MVSRDYTKELGLKSATPKVPWPIAIMILGAIAAGAWVGVSKLHAQASTRAHGAQAAATQTAAPAQVHR